MDMASIVLVPTTGWGSTGCRNGHGVVHVVNMMRIKKDGFSLSNRYLMFSFAAIVEQAV